MKKKVVTSIVVGSIIAQSTIPMYAEGIQKVNPYNLETAVSQEEIQSLSAKVEGIDGFASMILLATGELNSDTVKSPVPGYDFVCVKVGNTQIKSIGTYQDPESEKYLWYYSTDGVNATIFDDNSINQITAVFEKHVETYNVNYSFDESIIGVDGPKTVREGNDLSFTINVLDPNYEISSVTVNDVDYTERLNKNTLTIPADEITGNLDITINNAEITEFDVLYDDNFLMNGSVSGDQPTQVKKGGTYRLEFWSDEYVYIPRHGWKLNQVRVNGQELYLPDNSQKVGSTSKAYVFPNGMIATVKVIDKAGLLGSEYYKISLTIENVQDDLHIEKINFKNGKRYEVINRNIQYFDDVDNWYAENHVWHYSNITERDNVIENVSGKVDDTMNYPQFIFVNLKDGYDANSLCAYTDSSETNSIKLRPISDIQNMDFGKYNKNVKVYLMQKMQEEGKAYSYFIQVPEGQDVRFNYFAKKEQYEAKYDLNGGEWSYGGDSNKYDYFENSIIKVPTTVPTRKGFSFTGWQINDETYKPGQYIDFSKDSKFFEGKNEKNQFVLTAQWQKNEEIAEDTYLNYIVQLNEKQKDGSYKHIGSKGYVTILPKGQDKVNVLIRNAVEEIKTDNGYIIPKGFQENYLNFQTITKTNQVIEVNYDPIEYSISYNDLPLGSEPNNPISYTVLSDNIILKNPIDRPNDNVVFDGWYTDNKYENTITSIPIDENNLQDITLYAKYVDDKNNDNIPDDEQRVYINYDANGGSNPPVSFECLTKDTYKIAGVENMKHPDNYAFGGWTTEKIERPVNEQPEGIILPGTPVSQEEAGTYTYYAVWAVDENESGIPDYKDGKHYLTYDANGGINAPVDTNLYLSGKEYVLSTEKPTREGAIFYGWSLNDDDTLYEEEPGFKPITSVTFADKDIKVYAVWLKDTDGDGIPDYQEEKYTLTYDANGGKNAPVDENEYINGQVVTLSGEKPAREKAVFLGWSTAKHEGMVSEIPNDLIKEYTFGEGNGTVYAVWAADENEDGTPDINETKYTLSYDTNGGSVIKATEHLKGTSVSLKNLKPTKDKAVFLGWSDKDHNKDFTDIPSDVTFIDKYTFPMDKPENATVYAVWAVDENGNGTPDYQEEKYHLTYDANGGTNAPKDENEYLSGNTYSLSKEEPTREGAIFYGWSLNDDDTLYEEEPGFKPITSVTFADKDIKVYAVWLKDTDGDGIPDYQEEKYTLTYDANGGKNAPVDENEYINGQVVTLSGEKPAREKAVFLGWSTAKHEGMVSEIPNDLIKEYTFGEGNGTVYAVWAADENENGSPDYTEESIVIVETYAGNILVSSDEITMMVGDHYKLDGVETSIVYNGSTYLFDRIDNNDIVVDIDAKNNVIRVYYQLQQSPLEPSTPIDPEVPDNGGNPGNGGDNGNPNVPGDGENSNGNPNVPGNGGTPIVPNNPATDGNQAAAIGGNNTNLGGAPIADNNQTDRNNQETIDDNDIPQAGDNEDIKDNETPLAKSDENTSWSLLNLILGLLSILGAVFVFMKKREKVLMLVSGAGAVISTVAFILTQDMSAKMAMADSWTILFGIVLLAQIGSYILRNKNTD